MAAAHADIVVPGAEVRDAIAGGHAVVALETTIMTHGLPAPQGFETALECEAIVRTMGAVPATVGILDGKLIVGMTRAELERLAGERGVAKTNLSNLGGVLASRAPGSASVSTVLLATARAGVRVAATGGIGGVHRGYGEHFDISSDLVALGRFATVLVCAGAKSILDVAATREQLETRGVPVVGWRTEFFPRFYSRGRDLPVDRRVDGAEDAVDTWRAHEALRLDTAMLVVADPPADDALPAERIDRIVDDALAEATARGVRGRDVTPFILDRVRAMTGGESLRANLALIRNNCRVAGEIAAALARR